MAGGIQSQNVVGYNTLNTGDKTVMLGISFESTDGGDGILLGDITGDFIDEDNIQVASMVDGKVKFTDYIYYTEDYGYDPEGWYDSSDTYVSDSVRIPLGSAVWFLSSGSAKDITVSGQVASSEVVHTFSQTTEMVCSAFPTGFNPNAVTWSGLVDEDNIQVASIVNGKVKFTDYIYYTTDYGYDEDGWYDSTDTLVSDAITVAGQGFWLLTSDPTSVTMTEASPL